MNERVKMMIMITILNSLSSNTMMGILIYLLLFMAATSATTSATSSSTTKPFKELTNDEIIKLQSTQQQQNPHDISYIVSLNDETFEHMTQATTGQTTGSWLVWFYNSTDISSNNNILFDGTIPTVDEWLEQHIILGKVDISNSTYCKRTKQRFFDRRNDTSNIPSFIYLYHKQMYHILPQSIQTNNNDDDNNDQSSSSTTTKTKYSYYNWNELYKFCSSPPSDDNDDDDDKNNKNRNHNVVYKLYQRIPLPITYIDEILEQFIDNKSLFSGVAVFIMILGAIIGSLIEYCYDSIKNKNNKTKTTITTNKTTTTSNTVVKRKSKHEKSIKEE